uniref:Lectin/glucanase superfamily protein n=1 Tax=viral metagenome TaxID=1070528 RepID=A0A6C0KPR0_9ZZZZ
MSSNNSKFPTMRGGAMNTMFIGLIVVILVLASLYYVYSWLYAASTTTVTPILTGSPSMTSANSDKSSGLGAVSAVELTGINDAGQYSTSFWVYVADTKGFLGPGGSTQLAHLMEISNNRFSKSAPGNTLIYVGLNPVNASLVVRQSTMDPKEQINNSLTAVNGESYPLSSLIDNYNSGTTFSTNDRCDIVNGIEFQRWVLITVVGNSRTLDVYIDGKLARSCVYKSGFSLGSKSGAGTAYFGLNNNGNLKGYFASGNFYNYALTPDAVWKIYQNGPAGPFNAWNWLSSIFSVNANLNNSTLNELNPCTACDQQNK